MRTIQARVQIGPDHALHMQLPADTPTGEVEVLIVLQPRARREARAARARAIDATRGSLRDAHFSVREFVEERLDDEQRRERALGL